MSLNKEYIKKNFKQKLTSMFAEDINELNKYQYFEALSSVIKDYISKCVKNTNKYYLKSKQKQVYYFSMEFLIGRLLESNLINLGIRDICKDALSELGINLDEVLQAESDAGLGNGGLGRLAACFLDSMASIGIPGHGCGIRYKYGLFEQKIKNGYQVEVPDNWLKNGYVWETRKSEKSVIVKFGGDVQLINENGKLKAIHQNYEPILAVPYDIPVVGYKNNIVNNLRLWSAETIDKDFDFSSFSNGDYLKAVEYKYSVESITQVLYPDDSTEKGKLLRLKQEYFFVSAGLQSIIRRYEKMKLSLDSLDKYIAIHINDTHPSVAIAELMRILIDEKSMSWDEAWRITTNITAYTNHTILTEALEKWPVDMFKKLLPRIYMIIEEINRRFCAKVFDKFNGDLNKVNKMSIISNNNINMAYLSIVGSHSVNGVAKLHTRILKKQELKDFFEFYPDKFNNKTNGITHRRWLIQSNPKLTDLINELIGEKWIKHPLELKNLEGFSNDKSIQDKFQHVKYQNKINLSNFIKQKYNIDVDPDSIFDVQAKRLHAYKRQVLNILNILDLYNRLIENPNLDIIPRTFIFGAKASPGYFLAKQIIKLINSAADKINNDRSIKDKIKVVFLENYDVSLAQKLIPAADISEQISTASKEASGTGNMKFMMNGAITIATLDGANIEIKDAVGNDNIIIFGLTANEVIDLYKNKNYHSRDIFNSDQRVNKILTQLTNGFLGVSNYEFNSIYDNLLFNNDEYFVLKDFAPYVEAQNRINNLYRDKNKWNKMSILNIANSGVFSSDNTITKYANEIWHINKIDFNNKLLEEN
ncbi:glycogen/starch/alpha-glucan phosphorylase [Clostridium fermenticellae]|uniref:Alpha-1,4 glucan phosphorylase n=1 Tax=Clostridium fermenticellae TaxID=2068654 RepID=A0A386H376_9CLOT|nr:glycogen/starch/alpha-glucan phosphorylase [Clostridium fermenticellae]AYD40167.1 glycogen/starch/alpha-glucan phosphorylase [Clostridium fermenticellae]